MLDDAKASIRNKALRTRWLFSNRNKTRPQTQSNMLSYWYCARAACAAGSSASTESRWCPWPGRSRTQRNAALQTAHAQASLQNQTHRPLPRLGGLVGLSDLVECACACGDQTPSARLGSPVTNASGSMRRNKCSTCRCAMWAAKPVRAAAARPAHSPNCTSPYSSNPEHARYKWPFELGPVCTNRKYA